jgi:hypothetical protein
MAIAGYQQEKQFHPAKAGVISPDAGGTSGYEYSSSFAPVTGTETSGSVKMSVGQQGLQESYDHGWLGNHSLSNFVVEGTCVSGNTSCTSPPTIEIMMISGQEYCKASFPECFLAAGWLNGNITWHTGYVEVNQPDDGSYHPGGTSGAITLGYQLDNTNERLDIVANGTILGYFPYSYWGQTSFGAISEESIQSEAYQVNGNYGTEPYVSMDYTFSNFTDSNGNTLPTPAVSAGYSVSGISSTGWTVSGGRSPTDTSTSWPIELSQDNQACLADKNGTKSNGNAIVIENCNSWTSDQAWRWDSSDDTIRYQGLAGTYCLDDNANSTTNGTPLILESCTGLTGEEWTPDIISSGTFIEWVAGNGVMCINNPGNSTTPGTAISVYHCDGTSQSQQTDTYQY